MGSWSILTGLRDSLKAYLKANDTTIKNIPFTYECASYDEFQLDARVQKKQVSTFHIGIYEIDVSDLMTVDTGQVVDYTQGYEFSLFFGLGKEGEYDENAERVMMNVKDLVKSWCDSLEVWSITDNELATFTYTGSQTPIRRDKYVYLTVQFGGVRDDLQSN